MEIALGPGKTVVMNGFMMYMSGAGIHIFSIMITFMGIMNPAKAILGVHGGEKFWHDEIRNRRGLKWKDKDVLVVMQD